MPQKRNPSNLLKFGSVRGLTVQKEAMMTIYKKAGFICAVAVIGAMLSAMPISVEHSAITGIVLSVDKAQARVGRPATPVSVAGHHRRAVRRCAAGVTCY
jgi:hypothetical protein